MSRHVVLRRCQCVGWFTVWLLASSLLCGLRAQDEGPTTAPTADDLHKAGVEHEGKGEYAEAIADFQEAIRLDPKSFGAQNSIAWLYATCADAKFRNGKLAIEHAKAACELSEWKNPNSIDTLAAAYAETGNFDEAIRWQTKALEYFSEVEKKQYAFKLERFQHHQSHRDRRVEIRALLEQAETLTKERPSEATAMMMNALDVCKESFGEHSVLTANVMERVAGEIQWTGKRAAARSLREQALAIRKEIQGEKHPALAVSLNDLGFLLLITGDYAAARPYYEQALAINREIRGEKDLNTAVSLENLGGLFVLMSDYAAARPYYEQALAIKREMLGKKHPKTADQLNALGVASAKMGDYAAARSYHEQALAIRKEVLGEKHADTVLSLNNLAAVFQSMGDYAAARRYYEQALAIRKEVLGEKHRDTADSLNLVGILLSNVGDYAAARQCHEQALAIRKEVLGEEHRDTAASLCNLGTVFESMGEYAAARPYLERALAINKKVVGDKDPDTATMLSHLGSLLEELGDYAAARRCHEQALAINKEVLGEKHRDTANALSNLGTLLWAMGDYAAARPYYEQALAIHKEMLGEKHPHTAASLGNLGTLLDDLGDYAAARQCHEQALAIRKELLGEKHPDTAQSLNSLGFLLYLVGDYAAARPYYEQALAIRKEVLGEKHPDTATSLVNLAVLEAAAGDWAAAATKGDEARRVVRHHAVRVLPGLSQREQLNYLRRADRAPLHASLSMGLNHTHYPTIRDLSAGWLLNGKAVAQEALAEEARLAGESHDPKVAATLKELLEVRRGLATLGLATPRPGQEKTHREQLANLEDQEQKLSRRLAQEHGRPIARSPWIELAEVRKSMPADSVLVDIARLEPYIFETKGKENHWGQEDRYVAWIVPPAGKGNVEIIDLGGADEIDKAIEAARQPIAQAAAKIELPAEEQAERAALAPLTKLAALVLEPLKPHVKNAKQIILSPDSNLWLVPWAALPVEEGKYAIEHWQIRYVTSGRDLVAEQLVGQGAKRGQSGPQIFADPDYNLDGKGAQAATRAVLRGKETELTLRGTIGRSEDGLIKVDRLPGTAQEARLITPALTSYVHNKPTLYSEQFALEGVLKVVQSPRVLVLSTHGFYLPDQEVKPDDERGRLAGGEEGKSRGAVLATDGKPLENPLLRCGLLLAGCNKPSAAGVDDGVLTGMEIVGCDLRGTDLVVLSACETGLGQVRNGEGVAGLRQAFQLAGAKAVVSTLWRIPDKETALLMSDFFSNLAAGQSKAEALRNAQLALIKAHRHETGAAHPLYWAAFTVTGN